MPDDCIGWLHVHHFRRAGIADAADIADEQDAMFVDPQVRCLLPVDVDQRLVEEREVRSLSVDERGAQAQLVDSLLAVAENIAFALSASGDNPH